MGRALGPILIKCLQSRTVYAKKVIVMSLSEGQKLTLRAAVSGSGKSTGAIAIPVQWTSPPVLRIGLPPRVLRRVEEYIDLHLGETISLEALADVAGLS